MKIAIFNMENIFFRDERLIQKNYSTCLTSWMEEFENLMSKSQKPGRNYTRLRELSFLLGFHRSALEPYVILRRKAGQLYMRRKTGEADVKACSATGWNGWIKLCSRPVDNIAIKNKARLISEINPDILLVQEVEDRQSLLDFNDYYLPREKRFSNFCVLGGNDIYGRELGILTKSGYEILSSKNYADADYGENRFLFELDLQEYVIRTPRGEEWKIFSTWLSDRGGNREKSDRNRKTQAEMVADIYRTREEEGRNNIIVVGTFHVPSYCDSLSPLLKDTQLKELKKHPSFRVDLDYGVDGNYHSLGAYRMGVNTKQEDYFLVSPNVFRRISTSGLNRKGIFSEKQQFTTYSSVESEQTQASSHPAIWAEIN